MRRVTLIVLAAVVFLLLLDVVGELVVGKPMGFPYPSLGVVPLLVYIAVGALGAWRASFGTGLLAAAIVGFLDGTLGPLTSWMVGAGPVAPDITEPGVFLYSVVIVTAIAAAGGLLGAAAATWLERRRSLRGSRVVSR